MRFAHVFLGLIFLTLMSGCQSTSVNVVDLNKVLDIFQATLTELDAKGGAAEAKEKAVVDQIEPVKEEDKAKEEQFLTLFRAKLNAAKVSKIHVGVVMTPAGVFQGFADADKDNVKDSGEDELFKIDIDEERNRVVASDGGGHHRDHSYRHGGFFSGYMLGSMLSRNQNYYSGTRSGLRPDYGKTQMSPKTYHSSAVSKAKAAARSSSARSRTGSKGFSFGK